MKKKIKIIGITAVLCVLCAAIGFTAFCAGTKPQIYAENKKTNPGEEVVVEVSLKDLNLLNGKNISGAEFYACFDPNVLTPVSADCNGENLDGLFKVEGNKLHCLITEKELTGMTKDTVLCALRFAVSENAELGSYTNIALSQQKICTVKAENITQSAAVHNSKITIGEPAVVDAEIIRLGGTSRIDTAITICENGWESADTIIVTNAYSFADALAGGPLSYAMDAPILLTANRDSIEDDLLTTAQNLGAKNVVILGGPLAVNEKIETQFAELGYTVSRIAGTSRMETAVKIAEKLYEISGEYPKSTFIAYGYNYPDALAASSVAAITSTPILFAYADGHFDNSTLEYFEQYQINDSVILGGPIAVGEGCEEILDKMEIEHDRVYGTSRYNTALVFITAYNDVFEGNAVAFATGASFPDALAGGAFAAKKSIPVILVNPINTDDGIKIYVNQKNPDCAYIFGGEGAVSTQKVEKLLAK